jgi:ABC-type sugar transport system substrate-binding protein
MAQATPAELTAAVINGDLEVQIARDDKETIAAVLTDYGYEFTDTALTAAIAAAKKDPYIARMVQHFKPAVTK